MGRTSGRLRLHGRLAAMCVPLVVVAGVVATLAGCGSMTAGRTGNATPSATPTTQQQIERLVRQRLGSVTQQVSATYAADEAAATVTVTVGWIADVSAAQEQVKVVCFRAQAALWTSGIALRKVTVVVVGPLIDLYADRTVGPYGSAVLTAASAANMAWTSLNADGAWSAYDNVFIRQAFNDAG